MKKFSDSKAFDWDDLNQLVRRTAVVDGNKIAAGCAKGYRFLLEMTEDERQLANDPYRRQRPLWERLRAEVFE